MPRHAYTRSEKRAAARNIRKAKPLHRQAPVLSVTGIGFVGLLCAALIMPGTSPFAASVSEAAPTGTTRQIIASAVADTQGLQVSSTVQNPTVVRDGYTVTAPLPPAPEDTAKAHGLRYASTFSNDLKAAIQWPFAAGVSMSDGFGPRSSPGGIGSTNHKGVDFTPGEGADIQAVADGVVSVSIDTDSGLGVYVAIDHIIDGENVTSVYGHMLHGSRKVEVGDKVTVGQVIGNTGNTGTSTGAHTHFEIRLGGGMNGTPVDPYAWLEANAGRMSY